jgi:hypothetical protein
MLSRLIRRHPNLMSHKYFKPKDVQEILLKLRIYSKNQETQNLFKKPRLKFLKESTQKHQVRL